MKAVLKLCMNGITTNNSLDLERMSLYELDTYLMKNYKNSDDLRVDEWYSYQINNFLNKIPNRSELSQPNGSIRIFLEEDDGKPITEIRAFGGMGPQEVQKQVGVLYNNSWDLYHNTDYNSGIADFSKMRDYAVEYYKDNPDAFRELLKSCYKQLRRENLYGDYGLNTFMNYYVFEDVQKTMLGDTHYLFLQVPIHITNKKKYDKQVKDFIYGLRLKNLDEAYLQLREVAAIKIKEKKLKPRKIAKVKPPVSPKTLDDLVRQKFYKSYEANYSSSQINSMIEDYWQMQPEEQQEQRYNSISKTRK